jgi:hypothetical protein
MLAESQGRQPHDDHADVDADDGVHNDDHGHAVANVMYLTDTQSSASPGFPPTTQKGGMTVSGGRIVPSSIRQQSFTTQRLD